MKGNDNGQQYAQMSEKNFHLFTNQHYGKNSVFHQDNTAFPKVKIIKWWLECKNISFELAYKLFKLLSHTFKTILKVEQLNLLHKMKFHKKL